MSPIKKGTKLTDDPKNVRLEIRLTKGQSQMLEGCAKDLSMTKTDVIVKGIEKMYQYAGRVNRKK